MTSNYVKKVPNYDRFYEFKGVRRGIFAIILKIMSFMLVAGPEASFRPRGCGYKLPAVFPPV